MNFNDLLENPDIKSAVNFMKVNGYNPQSVSVLTDAVFEVELEIEFDDDEEEIRQDLFAFLCEVALKPD